MCLGGRRGTLERLGAARASDAAGWSWGGGNRLSRPRAGLAPGSLWKRRMGAVFPVLTPKPQRSLFRACRGGPSRCPLAGQFARRREREKRECFSKVSLVQMLHRMVQQWPRLGPCSLGAWYPTLLHTADVGLLIRGWWCLGPGWLVPSSGPGVQSSWGLGPQASSPAAGSRRIPRASSAGSSPVAAPDALWGLRKGALRVLLENELGL